MFGKCVTSLNALKIGIVKQSIGLEYIIFSQIKRLPYATFKPDHFYLLMLERYVSNSMI